MIRLLFAVIVISLLLLGAGSDLLLESRTTSGSAFTPTPLMIKVISYNILFGAGVDRQYDDLLAPELRNKNRLPELVSFLKGVKPDLLGIQEANGWNRGNPPIVEQVAEQLDMNYYLAEAPNEFHVVLFTKFKIAATENLSGTEGDIIFETMRGLRATLLSPDGQPLNIFVVHLDPFSTRIRFYQLDALIDELELYKEQITILLGDMNFCVGSPEYTILRQAGWQHIAVATDVDQIWISPAANWSNKPMLVLGNVARDLWSLSDHLPVGTELSLYPSSDGIPMPTLFPYSDRYTPGPDC